MGFDINIEMVLYMCNKTGKPYYYNKNSERIYEMPSVTVPKELVPYFTERGSVFHAYTEIFNEEERYNVSIEEFLEHYPSWDAVQEHSCYDGCEEWWVEDYHINFKKLLEWCMKQDVTFRISWSY
jgi:hypothetical protein